MSKKASEKSHARKRFFERYGLRMSKADHRQMVHDIKAGRARFLGTHTNRLTFWEVICQEKKVRVLYDNRRQCLVTCLPEHFIVDLKEGAVNEPPTSNGTDGSGSIDSGSLDADLEALQRSGQDAPLPSVRSGL